MWKILPKAAAKPIKSHIRIIRYPRNSRNGLLCLPKRRDFRYSVLHGNGEWDGFSQRPRCLVSGPVQDERETTVQKAILDPFFLFLCNLAPCVLCCKLLGKAHYILLHTVTCIARNTIYMNVCHFCLSFGDLGLRDPWIHCCLTLAAAANFEGVLLLRTSDSSRWRKRPWRW